MAVFTLEILLLRVSEVVIPSGTGLKSRASGLLDELGEVVAAGLEQAAGGVLGGPAGHLDARLAAAGSSNCSPVQEVCTTCQG